MRKTVKRQNTGQWGKQQWCHCSESRYKQRKSKPNEKTKSQGEDAAETEKRKNRNACGLQ